MQGTLTPDGACCSSGAVDACGVCDGDATLCPAQVTMHACLTDGEAASVAAAADPSAALRDSLQLAVCAPLPSCAPPSWCSPTHCCNRSQTASRRVRWLCASLCGGLPWVHQFFQLHHASLAGGLAAASLSSVTSHHQLPYLC